MILPYRGPYVINHVRISTCQSGLTPYMGIRIPRPALRAKFSSIPLHTYSDMPASDTRAEIVSDQSELQDRCKSDYG